MQHVFGTLPSFENAVTGDVRSFLCTVLARGFALPGISDVLFAGRELIALSIFRVFEPAPRSKSHSDSVGSALPAWRRRAHPNSTTG